MTLRLQKWFMWQPNVLDAFHWSPQTHFPSFSLLHCSSEVTCFNWILCPLAWGGLVLANGENWQEIREKEEREGGVFTLPAPLLWGHRGLAASLTQGLAPSSDPLPTAVSAPSPALCPAIFLCPVHTFANCSLIKLPSDYSVWVSLLCLRGPRLKQLINPVH